MSQRGDFLVSRMVLLDAGPLGMISHPRKNPETKVWLQNLIRSGTVVRVPEIADYEVRRELLRANKAKGIQRLDSTVALLNGGNPRTQATSSKL